ncbi:ABC transporter ATP-binding protein [Limosilactobacillus sp.]|jgi:ABC-2 type transport system ATP-binding protein|uniref:ABC transporter ATP-binding protein n=1 Tax=Limosilactobacillus sp. TaxID=2773925 RepID=UPI0025C6BBCE|nr:ATP-binding cassette domain-containing protein [Limosilactobacillus sp.]MCH3921844.1 ATP-binding cassette domain-containing protein [Limosilactobacillus sp.]MCH3928615.1 ATP-binding cassette domain-containing protein [Limosilactobacillus sp.]
MLTVKNLNIYYGRKRVIENASFTVRPGEIVGLIGPNGAGKSTIMKTLLGLTKFNGSVVFNDQPITENSHQVLQHVGALIENPALYPFLTGLENLELYAKDKQGMHQLITTLGMDSYIAKRAGDYSIGMKQKLGIALALLDHPDLVILDEPMNGLDIESTILIRRIIHEYAARGTAFLISSHVLSELQKVMTSVIILNHHRIIMDEPMAKFQRTDTSKYQLLTVDMPATERLLDQAGIHFGRQDPYLLVAAEDIDAVQRVLAAHQILLRELAPRRLSFEQVIVGILRDEKAGDQQ